MQGPLLQGPHSECDAEASDRRCTPLPPPPPPSAGAANKRQVLSAVARPPHRLILEASPLMFSHSADVTPVLERRSGGNSGRRCRQGAESKDTAGCGGAEADCRVRTGLLHLAPGLMQKLCLGIQPSWTSAGPAATQITGSSAASSGDAGNCTHQMCGPLSWMERLLVSC